VGRAGNGLAVAFAAVSIAWVEPFAAALALRNEPGLVLLESMPGFGHLGRRSFLAARPAAVAHGTEALENGVAPSKPLTGAGASRGWWAGWLSYDLGREIEQLPAIARDELGLPALALGRYDAYLEFDHLRREIGVQGEGESRHLLRALQAGRNVDVPEHRAPGAWESSLPRSGYERAVQEVVDYIRAGDVFQVNLTHRLCAPWSGDPFALYARLRASSPAPFMALLRLPGADVVSASPERFLRRRGMLLETRPIKGTRPRGRTRREDRVLAAELRESAKDRAENIMIVDLARNDLGRVCRYGSVHVRRLCALERHPGVHHLVSVVDGVLEQGIGPVEIVRAAFPPGSVTGAPKIRAMEIIEELEPVRRGVYCGSVGWIGPDGDLDLSVAIRTFIAARGRLHLHVGGAVVADSEPAAEWRETMDKAARLLHAAGGEVREPRGARWLRRARARERPAGAPRTPVAS
jgi:para-aminobenzoate synthetase component I